MIKLKQNIGISYYNLRKCNIYFLENRKYIQIEEERIKIDGIIYINVIK